MLKPQRFAMVALAAVMAAVALTGSAGAGDNDSGFQTAQPAMLTPLAAGSSVTPIMNVGETLGSGYMLESIPDGISLQTRGQGRADVYLNHETSLVPFPFTPATGVGQSDYTNAMVSHLTLNQHSAGVLQGRYVIPSSANFQRFCSNFLAVGGADNGFERTLLFTNEETSDFVNRTGLAWPPGPGAEQAGVVVAFDPQRKEYRPIYGMGRHNHENSVAVPGYAHPVLLSGDDTFTAPSSQLYMYTADSAAAVWNDEGSLWAFRSDNPLVNDYSDLSGSATASGRFIPVPQSVALGDQTGLENWSNANNVFQFIRVEDIAFDRNHSNVVYFADTGEPRALPGPGAARMTRGPSGTRGPFPNGRIFKLVLDPADETHALSLSILVEGDPLGPDSAGNPAFIHNPDNVETTGASVLFQEDPGSQNQYAASNAAGTTARVWRYDLASGTLSIAAKVNQAGDPAAAQGSWESSGIVDASEAFGPGVFLLDVQAHTILMDVQQVGTLTFKREGGQLLLLRIPGA
jgi:uncharacterized protein DUF839